MDLLFPAFIAILVVFSAAVLISGAAVGFLYHRWKELDKNVRMYNVMSGVPPVASADESAGAGAPARPVHIHKFVDWPHLPDSEINDIMNKTRCCNMTTSSQFCVYCFHAPDCENLAK